MGCHVPWAVVVSMANDVSRLVKWRFDVYDYEGLNSSAPGHQHQGQDQDTRGHFVQWYAPIKIIGIKIIVPIKSEKSLRLMVHISKTLTKSLR
jgi:hypothetical protein